MRFVTISSSVLVGLWLSQSNALAKCDPREFLKDDIDIVSTSDVFRLSYLQQISKEHFEIIKKNGSISVIIPETEIPANISYDDFKKIVTWEYDNRQVNISTVQYKTIYRSHISDTGAQAYINCVKNEKQGVFMEVDVPTESLSNEEFFVSVTWRGPVGKEKGNFDILGPAPFLVLGGEILGPSYYDNIKEIRNGQTIKIPVKRNLAGNFYFSASVDGYSDEISIPPKLRKSTIHYDVVVSSSVRAYSNNSNDWGDMERDVCIRAKHNEAFLVSTALVVDEIWEGEDRNRVWSRLKDNSNQKNICLRVRAHVSTKAVGANIVSHIEVLRATFPE